MPVCVQQSLTSLQYVSVIVFGKLNSPEPIILRRIEVILGASIKFKELSLSMLLIV